MPLNIKCLIYIAIIYELAANGPLVFANKVRKVELQEPWSLRNGNGSIEVHGIRIPSGVYTALEKWFGNLLHSTNDEKLRWISYDNWTYINDFEINPADFVNVRSVNLTLYGIDTIATIRLNDKVIGQTNNMFVRYSFDVLPYLLSQNRLEIAIVSPVWAAKSLSDSLLTQNIATPPDCPPIPVNKGECHRNMLRKMQTSFGGKWNLAAPSMGIWKSIALEYYEVALMRDIDIALQKNSTHWTMDIRAFLSTGMKQHFYCELTLYAPELLDDNLVLKRDALNSINSIIDFQVAIPLDRVILWWPNGYGVQKLYPLSFYMNCWLDSGGPNTRAPTISTKYLKIGFRTIELVEDLDDNGRTFYFKINGVPIFMKGAIYMPAHILPEEADNPERVRHILHSAKMANMNMIRVWGGGLYESEYFYNLADFYGLLIWQDMAFTEATYPMTDEFVESVRLETSQNARRLAYHPSLAMIVTNDEIELYLTKSQTELGSELERLEQEYKQLFMGTIMHILNTISRNEFNPRPGPMISTPSMGIEESKKNIMPDPQNINYGDIHFWEQNIDAWDPDIYPWARFVSKYGFMSLPVMTSWNRSLAQNDTINDMIWHRLHYPEAFYSMLQLIHQHLPVPIGEWHHNATALIYFSQVVQAMAAKTATELFRSRRVGTRTMGALYWQLNDVWVAPSWSSIDYYGNYKLLYYWFKEFLAPTTIIALYDAKNRAVNVTLIREGGTEFSDPRKYDITMNTYLWSELYAQRTINWQAILDSNDLKKRIIPLDNILVQPFNASNCFIEFVLSESECFISRTYLFPVPFFETVGIKDPQITLLEPRNKCTGEGSTTRTSSYSVSLVIRRPALFVYLEVYHPEVINYRFAENGFVQVEPIKTVQLEIEVASDCLILTEEHIKVLTMNKFMLNSAGLPEEPLSTITSVEMANSSVLYHNVEQIAEVP